MALIDDVIAVRDRLASQGWADLMNAHGLDLAAADLGAELSRPLPDIDRDLPGFEDFAQEGTRAIQPGNPARSLLFHALASPNVLTAPDGNALGAFPTLAELDTLENYVYGVRAPSMPELFALAGGAEVAIVAFAHEYRPSIQTPHQKHADVCVSRTGIARVGTAEPRYDGPRRGFLPGVADNPHGIRVLPARYAAYLAVLVPGNAAAALPMRHQAPDPESGEIGDQARNFWVPLHKLFPGNECIRGRNLTVRLRVRHVNEKLRRIHLALGPDASWGEPDISRPPFRFTDGIAALTTDTNLGQGTVVPAAHSRLVEPAAYQGKPLTFLVPPNAPLSSSFNLAADGLKRHGPEYVHVRHRITDTGEQEDLNKRRDVVDVVAGGGYQALHYLDFTGDGWVEPVVPELAVEIPRRRAAYSLVTAPDFFPGTDQRELTEWVAQRVPSALRRAIWRIPPDPLSDERFPANLQLTGARFRADDDTVTAIVSRPLRGLVQPTRLNVSETQRHSHLPDDAAGVFAPGWDVSVDGREGGPEHLAAYGLGSPFPEDSKLCAALSSFWPAVAPDAARTFEPSPVWPTVIPLTDEEIGSVGELPWDGVPGPRLIERDGRQVVEYADLAHADYVENSLQGRFSMALTGVIGEREYEARVLAMVRAYQALGVDLGQSFRDLVTGKTRWTVLSFRPLDLTDEEVSQAEKEADVSLAPTTYRFEVFRRGGMRPHPTDVSKTHVDIQQLVRLLVDPVTVLIQDGAGPWREVD